VSAPTDVWQRERGVPREVKSWRIGPTPVIPEPCECERPYYFRDQELGIKCLICGKRRRTRGY
jgi:hypothetical protein